jgi:hypothetical protein
MRHETAAPAGFLGRHGFGPIPNRRTLARTYRSRSASRRCSSTHLAASTTTAAATGADAVMPQPQTASGFAPDSTRFKP